MKNILAVLFLSSLNSLSVAGIDEGQLGLGLQVSGDSNTISVPYRLSSNWRIEPFFSYTQGSSKTNGTSSDGFEELSEYESKQFDLGVSLARTLLTEEKFSLYSGFSLAYVKKDSDSRRVDGNLYETDFTRNEYKYDNADKSELTGYETGLSFGLQYKIFDNIELAGEVALNYRDLSGDETNGEVVTTTRIDNVDASNNTTDVETELVKSDKEESAFYTSSKLIVRIYF